MRWVVIPCQVRAVVIPAPEILRERALAESCIPVKPGNPGESPFWNTYAHRFIYAPAFEFAESESADIYRYSIIPESSDDTLVFMTDNPGIPCHLSGIKFLQVR